MSHLQELKRSIENALREAYGVRNVEFEKPPVEEFGDLATNVCFLLAKELKKSPEEIASETAKKLKFPEGSGIAKVEARNGYLNFFFDWKVVGKKLLKEILELRESYGKPKVGKRRIMIEHTSVNPNKAIHIGHARNACLGDSLARFLRWCGHEVIVANYINDAGSQMADLIIGFKVLGFPLKKSNVKFDVYCGDEVYVKVNRLYKERPELLEKKKEIVKEIEDKDSDIAKFNRKIASEVVKAQLQTLWRLGIFYDVLIRETDVIYSKLWDKVFNWLRSRGLLYKAESGKKAGCWLLKLSDLPEFRGLKDADKVFVRSDGTKVYAASDTAYALWKHGLIDFDFSYKEFVKQPNGKILWETTSEDGAKTHPKFNNVDTSINVIDVRQSYEQSVVKTALKLIAGREIDYVHYAYEVVSLSRETARKLGIEFDETKQFVHMSGRKGWFVNADTLLQALVERAREETKKRNPSKSEEFINKTAEAIAISALRYGLLRISPERLLIFDVDEALRLEGNSAPYLQYAYTRCCGIMRKAKEKNIDVGFEAKEINQHEKRLLAKLLEFPEVVKKCHKELRLHYLCDYAFKLATLFNEFYNACPVIGAGDEKIMKFRLAIVKAVATVLKTIFSILGIVALERM